ncbi:predicted protein [Arabidopsis lyrata subsp. lyrata]|uniref:Predicted protein n=1 Tax=Arabidopsis lyrata subsp. lyrata TaxID=81972 RepID=D7KMP2_ARALL|nr:predicted protein [Arabidopsis lyrata subsp. lyrata]
MCISLPNYREDEEQVYKNNKASSLYPTKQLRKTKLKGFKSFLITVQETPKLRGSGSVVKCHFKYERIDEEVAHPEKLLALFVKAFKDMDEMLLSEV